jgi:uncharacterized membrane protein YgcG
MNMKREAALWSVAITAAVALGLVVVWAALALAFNQPNFTPLYYVAAPYSQDDYSAEGVDSARLNPLNPSLEQEVNFDGQPSGTHTSNPVIVAPEPVVVATPPEPVIVLPEPVVAPMEPIIVPRVPKSEPVISPKNNGNGGGNDGGNNGGGNDGGNNGGGNNGGGNDGGNNGGGNGKP